MENADENKSHICLYAFPNLPKIINKNNIKTIETNINEFLIQSKLLLQPDYQYSTQLIVDEKGDFPLGLSLLLLVEGVKTKVCTIYLIYKPVIVISYFTSYKLSLLLYTRFNIYLLLLYTLSPSLSHLSSLCL